MVWETAAASLLPPLGSECGRCSALASTPPCPGAVAAEAQICTQEHFHNHLRYRHLTNVHNQSRASNCPRQTSSKWTTSYRRHSDCDTASPGHPSCLTTAQQHLQLPQQECSPHPQNPAGIPRHTADGPRQHRTTWRGFMICKSYK